MMPTAPPRWLRALATWLVIFPLVGRGQWAMSALPSGVPLIARAFALTIVVVPIAVYVGVPWVTKTLIRLAPRGRRSSAG